MIVKDSMVVIHLAKMAVLEKCCRYFGEVVVPEKVYEEIMFCRGKNVEVNVIDELVEKKKIVVKKVLNDNLLKMAYQFNIQRGEAEAVALYWQEEADYFASDDSNVRKKKVLLELNLIGTPVILLKLFRDKKITKNEFLISVGVLKKVGWFSNAVIDKLLMEVK